VAYSAYPILNLIDYFELLLFCYLTGNADMHLKNFSLYKPHGEWTLAPAYDLVSTKLAIPQDDEELALTLNGKKRKLKHTDFDSLIKETSVEDKAIENVYNKFRQVIPTWLDFIDTSFLPHQLKEKYKALIQDRWTALNKP
jgi:serine/threonine-protein kinase HipA